MAHDSLLLQFFRLWVQNMCLEHDFALSRVHGLMKEKLSICTKQLILKLEKNTQFHLTKTGKDKKVLMKKTFHVQTLDKVV